MNQLALQFPGQPLAIREVSLWTVVRARLTFLSVWARSSPGCLSGPSCPLVLVRGWKRLFWSLTLAVSHTDDPCMQTASWVPLALVLASRRLRWPSGNLPWGRCFGGSWGPSSLGVLITH